MAHPKDYKVFEVINRLVRKYVLIIEIILFPKIGDNLSDQCLTEFVLKYVLISAYLYHLGFKRLIQNDTVIYDSLSIKGSTYLFSWSGKRCITNIAKL